jgi:hypothetical protein
MEHPLLKSTPIWFDPPGFGREEIPAEVFAVNWDSLNVEWNYGVIDGDGTRYQIPETAVQIACPMQH